MLWQDVKYSNLLIAKGATTVWLFAIRSTWARPKAE